MTEHEEYHKILKLAMVIELEVVTLEETRQQ